MPEFRSPFGQNAGLRTRNAVLRSRNRAWSMGILHDDRRMHISTLVARTDKRLRDPTPNRLSERAAKPAATHVAIAYVFSCNATMRR